MKRRAGQALAPLARRLHGAGLTPNAVSIAGGLVAACAGIPAALGHFGLAAVLFLAGSSLDALDGALARLHGMESRLGAVLDATLDRIGEGALWTGLVFYFASVSAPGKAALAAAAMIFSLMTSYLRAWGERFGVVMAEDWLTRPERVLIITLALALGRPSLAAGGVALMAAVAFLVRAWRLARRL